MGSLGKYVIEADPKNYGDADPDQVERNIVSKLNSDQRDLAIRELRRVFPRDTSALDDDAVHATAIKQAGYDAPASGAPDPERAKKLQDYGATQSVIKAWKPLVINAARTQQSPTASEADKEAASQAKEAAISPQELVNPRVPSVDWATMKRMRDQDPNLHVTDASDQNTFVGRNFGWMNPRVQLQDKTTGIAKAQLDPTATYPAYEVEGIPKYLPTWDTITGTSDPFQRLTAMGAAAVYNPFAKEGERVLGNPADVAKSTIPQGIGLPEYGKQAGKNLEGNPLVAPFAGTANVLATGAGAIPSALGYVFEKAASAFPGAASEMLRPHGRRLREGERPLKTAAEYSMMADENAQELARARADLEQQIVKPDVARAGENLGMVAQAVNPLSIANIAGGPIIKAGSALLGAGVKRGAQALEHAYPAGSNGIADAARGAATLFSETPSALVAPGESGTSVRSGVAAMRSEPAIHERKLYEEMFGKVKAATGASDEEVMMLDRLAAEHWNTPEARLAAVQQDPRVAAVFEFGQPYHEATLRSAYGDKLAYNPLHTQYGQNVSKSNQFMEREIGHRAHNNQIIDALEQQNAVGATIHPSAMRGVPGISDEMITRMTTDPAYEAREADLMEQIQNYGYESRGLGPKLDIETAQVRAPMAADIDAIRENARLEELAQQLKGEERVRQLKLKGNLASKRVASAYDKPIEDTLAYGANVAEEARRGAQFDTEMNRTLGQSVRDIHAQKLADAAEQKRLNILEQQLIAEHRIREASDVRTLAEWKAKQAEIRELKSSIRDQMGEFRQQETARHAAEAESIRSDRGALTDSLKQHTEFIKEQAEEKARQALDESRVASRALKQQQADEARRAYGHQDITNAMQEYRALMDDERRQGRVVVDMYKQGKQEELENLRSEYQKGSTAARGEYADLVSQLKELQKQGPSYGVVPRRGRSIEDTYNLLKETRLSPGRLQEVEKLGAMGGIAKTARRVEEGKGLGQKALYRSVFDDLQLHREAKPTSWRTVDEYAIRHGINEPIVGEEGMNVIRQGTGDFNMNKTWADKLRANDDVLLRVVPDAEYDVKDFQRAPLGVHRITYSIPQSLAPANLKSGMIIDRRVAQALMEAANPSAAMDAAERGAAYLESVLGSGQINKAATLGRGGFSLRNRFNELHRVLVHDPNAVMDKTVASIADEVSHSSVGHGGRAVTELPPNPVTGKPYTIGELHELALSQTGMGRGSLQEAQGLVSEFPRAMWSDTKVGRAIDKASELGMAPGVAINKAQDELFKKAMFPNVSPRYGAEDAMRLRVFINELKNGVRPSIAGNTARNLMIDFGDLNALQRAGKFVFPFIKYQSSAGPQMMRMILDNPNRFAHAYRFAKYLEHEDAREHGGTGINSKYKSVSDMLGGAPALTDTATTARVSRPDTANAEFAGQVENLGKFMDSDSKFQSAVEAFMGPAWSDLYAARTGLSANTGRNVFNVDSDTFKSIQNERQRSSNPLSWMFPRSYMANALYERQQREQAAGINESYLGAHPEFGRAYEVLKGLPLVSRPFASDPWNLAARAYNGGSNPASRAQETSKTMMERALTSYLTGLRSSTIDYPQVAARNVQETGKTLPKTVEQSIKRKAMQGRIGNP